jgi:hypothetical protein
MQHKSHTHTQTHTHTHTHRHTHTDFQIQVQEIFISQPSFHNISFAQHVSCHDIRVYSFQTNHFTESTTEHFTYVAIQIWISYSCRVKGVKNSEVFFSPRVCDKNSKINPVEGNVMSSVNYPGNFYQRYIFRLDSEKVLYYVTRVIVHVCPIS